MPGSHVALSCLSKLYNSQPILQQIQLEVHSGEFVSLIGPSGCGKSTVLKLISGLTEPSAGTVAIDGRTPAAVRKSISFIFQDPTLLPWRTVEQNVGLHLELNGVAKHARREKVAQLLDLVGLSHAADLYPRQLSGGMRMRVSIARALSTQPKLLLMDEPFAALDEISRDRLNEEILRLQAEQGWTALFVTHSVAEAVFLSTRVLVLAAHPGRVAQEVAIDLPQPRTAELRTEPIYEALVARVSRSLRTVTLAERRIDDASGEIRAAASATPQPDMPIGAVHAAIAREAQAS